MPIGATRITPPHPLELLCTGSPLEIFPNAPMQVMPGARRAHRALMRLIQLSGCSLGASVWVRYQLR